MKKSTVDRQERALARQEIYSKKSIEEKLKTAGAKERAKLQAKRRQQNAIP